MEHFSLLLPKYPILLFNIMFFIEIKPSENQSLPRKLIHFPRISNGKRKDLIKG